MRRAITFTILLALLAGTVAAGDDRTFFGKPPAEEKEKEAKPASLEGYAPFEHPLGFRFQRPRTWRVQEIAQGLLLVPPDTASGPEGQLEYYLVTAMACPKEITSLDDPRVRQFQTQTVQSMLPVPPAGPGRREAPRRERARRPPHVEGKRAERHAGAGARVHRSRGGGTSSA
jgi:hypothetical protein